MLCRAYTLLLVPSENGVVTEFVLGLPGMVLELSGVDGNIAER